MKSTYYWQKMDVAQIARCGIQHTQKLINAWGKKAHGPVLIEGIFATLLAHADRDKAWRIIRDNPHITWLVESDNLRVNCLPPDWGDTGYPNVWLGAIPFNALGRGVYQSMSMLMALPARKRYLRVTEACMQSVQLGDGWRIDWVVAGNSTNNSLRVHSMIESTSAKIYFHLHDQCRDLGIPFYFTGLKEWMPIIQTSPGSFIHYSNKEHKRMDKGLFYGSLAFMRRPGSGYDCIDNADWLQSPLT